jgi:hypothetical protein
MQEPHPRARLAELDALHAYCAAEDDAAGAAADDAGASDADDVALAAGAEENAVSGAAELMPAELAGTAFAPPLVSIVEGVGTAAAGATEELPDVVWPLAGASPPAGALGAGNGLGEWLSVDR